MTEHLWETKHPYYCNDANYFTDSRNDHGVTRHESWAAYLEEFALSSTDLDLNLVFRWDWKRPEEDGYGEFAPDDALHLYHMQQRRGAFWVHIVRVTETDEDSVREYLSAYAEHMRLLWSPLLDTRYPTAGA